MGSENHARVLGYPTGVVGACWQRSQWLFSRHRLPSEQPRSWSQCLPPLQLGWKSCFHFFAAHQNRERIYIVGVMKTYGREFVFPRARPHIRLSHFIDKQPSFPPNTLPASKHKKKMAFHSDFDSDRPQVKQLLARDGRFRIGPARLRCAS